MITPDISDALWVAILQQERIIFETSVKVKKLLHSPLTETPTREPRGVKLPKIDVPTFNNVLGTI